MKPRRWQQQTGAVLLSGVIHDYVSQDVRRRGHNLDNILRALVGVGAPPSFEYPDLDAFDVLTGFLVLDALIANQDRHDENWAVLRPPGATGRDLLCGSYDHSSSLGFNLRPEERRRRLAAGTVDQWVRRGRATRFDWMDSERPPTLVDLAWLALSKCSPIARSHWRVAIEGVTKLDIMAAGSRVPTMSEDAATFAYEVILENRRRLLDAW